MTYGVHVFARAKVIPDLAIERGLQAYDRARAMGDRALEFLSAIGTAHAYLEIEDADQAERWLLRAADCASSFPTPHRARQVATVGALLAALRGDAAGMRAGLGRVVQMAAGQHRPAAQCQALALLAMTAAQMGADANDDELLVLQRRRPRKRADWLPSLPAIRCGRPRRMPPRRRLPSPGATTRKR